MLLSDQQYQNIINILKGKEKKSEFFCAFEQWFQQTFQIKMYGYICDETHDGRKRLKIVLWNHESQRKMKDGINWDISKQKDILQCFLTLSQKYHLYPDYDHCIISYDTLEDEIKKRILQKIKPQLDTIHRPYIWKIEVIFDQVHVFFKTDEQIRACQQTGICDEMNQKILDFIKPIDDLNVFDQNFSCVFTSRQTLNEKYNGSLFNYTR